MRKSPTTQSFAIAAALLCATLASHAASLQYLGGNNVDTNWNVDANWTGGSVPGSGDTALVIQNRRAFVDSDVAFGGILVNQSTSNGAQTSEVDVRTGGILAVSTVSNGTVSGGDGVINVTGGTMSASGTVTNHGTIQLSSGTLSLSNTATSGFNRALDTASGILNVTGGALIAGAAMTDGNIQFRSTIVISGGSFTAGAGAQAFFADGASLTINGDAATIGFGFLAQNRTVRAADLNFNFGATGVGTIVTAGWMSLTDATINVDGSGYTGGAGVFDLITSSSFSDGAVFAGQSVTGFTGLNGVVSASGNDLILTLTELPYATELASVAALGTDAAMLAAPVMYADDTTMTTITVSAGERKAVYFAGLDYLGSPTRVFAYVGIPAGASASSPVPAVVLVHGGGGHAFSAWVQKWNNRGYAAISMSVEGHTDTRIAHAMAGPSRAACYHDTDVEPITDQWMYHAVADTVLANSLMRSLPEVVAEEVGLMGMSWGGIITSTTIGIDTRFRFAIPTYGCGHLYDARNYYGAQLGNNDKYKQIWDPMVRIANATMPVLWLSWPEDQHFPMDSFAYSYHGVSGPYMVSQKPGMGHFHKFNIAETYDFADSIISNGSPWCVQQSIGLTGSAATVVFTSTKTLNSASLVYTTGNDEITTGTDTNLEWIQTTLSAPEESPAGTGIWTVTATLPAGVTGWFINVKATGYNNAPLTASSDYQENIALLADALAMDHPLADNQSTDTVNVSYSGPANVEISSITISGESHAGSFSSLTAAPLVLLTPTPDTTPVTIQFDNTVASLTEGQTATATLTIVWDELDGSTDQISLPLSATAAAAFTVVHDASADWDSQNVNLIDHVILQNDATVTVGEFVEPNLVVGGSFEAPDVADGIASGLVAGNGTLTGWAITAAGVTVIDSWNNGGGIDPAPVGSDGEQFLQLQRHPDGAGTISQTLATEDGATYQLTFDYSGIYPGTSGTTITYNVGGDAQSVDLTLVNGQVPWASETFEFTATAGGTALSFTGEKVAGFWGASIDNVSVTVVPATSDAADTIIVNDGASPTTATLNIHQDYSLTATTSIELGGGTGAGIVNQSTGTVTTADLAINDSGTGDTSQYNLSGGELSVSSVISINANGELNQTGGTISGSGTIANNGSFSYDSTTNQTLSGVISGAGSVTKDGTGTLTLSASNTYTGGTTVNAGLLDLVGQNRIDGALTVDGTGIVKLSGTSHNAFGGISSVTLQNGGTFTDNSLGGLVQSVSAPVTFTNGGTMTSEAGANGTGGFGNYLFINGINVTGTGLATISASGISFNNGQTITVADTVAGSGTDLLIASIIKNDRVGTNIKAGAGTLTLTGINTDTSPWSITAGTLEIGGAGQLEGGSYAEAISNNGVFAYNSTADQTLSGVISSTGSVTKDGTGTLTISNHGTYSGATTILDGTLKLSGSQKRNLATTYTVDGASAVLEAANIQVFSAFGSSYDKELTATNGGTIKATSVAIRIGDVTLQNGSRLTANGSDGTYGGCYIGQLAGGASPTVTVTGSGASQIDGTGNMTLVSTIFEVEDVTGNNAADLTVSLSLQNMTGISFTGNVQIDGAVTKTGAGTLTLSATNSYTGATTVSAGILSLGNGTNNTALNDAADMIVASGAMLNLNYTGTDTIDELSLGGALQTPGIWGASGSGATFINDSFFSGGGTLTVGTGPEPTAYQSWGVDNGLSDADALTTANPESDGLSNLLEFAFGTDPTVSNGSSIAYGSGVTPGLPLLVLETITSNNVDSRAVFARRKEWVAAGLTYTVQFSADLSEWVDSSETPTLLESGSGDIDAVYVDYPLIIQTTAGFEKAQFFRLSVSHD